MQENSLQYVVTNYKKWVDLSPLIRKIEDVDLSSKKYTAPIETRNKDPTEKSKKIYELELKHN